MRAFLQKGEIDVVYFKYPDKGFTRFIYLESRSIDNRERFLQFVDGYGIRLKMFFISDGFDDTLLQLIELFFLYRVAG